MQYSNSVFTSRSIDLLLNESVFELCGINCLVLKKTAVEIKSANQTCECNAFKYKKKIF